MAIRVTCIDDRLADGSDRVDHGHAAVTDRGDDALELWRESAQAQGMKAKESYT